MIEHRVGVHTLWVGLGTVILVNAALLYFATPKEQFGPMPKKGASARS
jgi:hypothetical protein